MQAPGSTLPALLGRIAGAASRAGSQVRLLAVSKGQPTGAIRALASAGQRAFGENYLQEALAKMDALAALALEWHFIGRLQSNKCRDVAARFAWVQSVDRPALVPLLAGARPAGMKPLNVLLQVNVEREAGKGGCAPDAVAQLAAAVAAEPRLRLRGLMAIPAPADLEQRRAAFAAVRRVFEELRERYDVDTLSMGMSEDFELAISEGATLVRIGTALFGPRT